MKIVLIALLIVPYLVLGGVASNLENPVLGGENLPDPGVVFYNGLYYVATTTRVNIPNKFPIHSSPNLQDWKLEGYAFVKGGLPSWSTASNYFWAPELHVVNGNFRLIYTAAEASSGLLCIGIATAHSITGPYRDLGAPIIKNRTVGSIDAHVLTISSSERYLIWKDDGNGNQPQIPTWIKAQRLHDNATGVTGDVFYLLRNTLPWEADVVEGPWIISRNGFYYLFYSGHSFCDKTYAVGVAISQNPLGPYEKKGDPILKSNAMWKGPGHCSVVQGDQPDSWYMVYHAWHQGQVCGTNNRVLMADPMYWDSNGWPYILNSSPSYPRQSFLF